MQHPDPEAFIRDYTALERPALVPEQAPTDAPVPRVVAARAEVAIPSAAAAPGRGRLRPRRPQRRRRSPARTSSWR